MKRFYLLFLAALLLDIVIAPLSGVATWFPSFLLASIPFFFLFSSRQTLVIIFIVSALLVWFFAGVNLGVALFSFGVMIFFERWVLLQFFQYETWQILVFAAASPLLFGVLVVVLDGLLLSKTGFVTASFFVGIITSSLLAVGINFVLRHTLPDRSYEKATL